MNSLQSGFLCGIGFSLVSFLVLYIAGAKKRAKQEEINHVFSMFLGMTVVLMALRDMGVPLTDEQFELLKTRMVKEIKGNKGNQNV